jgi:pimeloyl-ACP methyl ester carboxylesterase
MMALRTATTELSALATTALSMVSGLIGGSNGGWDLDAPHPTPVVFVHGFLGHATNFRILGQTLADAGARNTAQFSYGPTLDYQRLAGQLGRTIEEVCAATGARRVDVVGHSLGGLAARYLLDSGDGERVRRLVTLGSPYYASVMPARELAIFAADDPLIPLPEADRLAQERVKVVPECGHLGLLYHPEVLREVCTYLTARREGRIAKLRIAA